jgi:non-canonical poly(A) RNA polymerase PAPD5/7
MVMKCLLKQRDLNETYKGGIGSFLLFCMILAFLRELRRQFIEKKKMKELVFLYLLVKSYVE